MNTFTLNTLNAKVDNDVTARQTTNDAKCLCDFFLVET